MLRNLLETVNNTEPKQDYTMLIILGVVAILFIFMTINNSKQRKKQMAEDQKKKDSLCKGTKITTIGGVIGVVVSVDHENNTFVLNSEGNNIKFDKRAIYYMELPEDANKVQPIEEVKAEEVKAEEVKTEEVKTEEVKAKKTKKSSKTEDNK